MDKIIGADIYIRPMIETDIDFLTEILTDKSVMYAWEKTFSKEEIQSWHTRHMTLSKEKGIGYMLVFLKDCDAFIGQAGLLEQSFLEDGELGIGYMLKEKYWGKGYATMAASLLFKYGKTILGAKKICCDIRPENTSSISVAKRLGMQLTGTIIKIVGDKEMPHIIYKAENHPMEMGYYRHFKGNEYILTQIAYHSETQEPYCIYIPQYKEMKTWVRPAHMWNDVVLRNGNIYPRFEYIRKD